MPGSRRRVLLRRSKYLVAHWRDDRFILEDYATGAATHLEPLSAVILHYFHRWRSPEGLYRALPDISRPSLAAAVDVLVGERLLERSDRSDRDLDRRMRTWSEWNPAAGWFHQSTKDLTYTDWDTSVRATTERLAVERPPAPTKRYRNVARVQLPVVNDDSELATTLRSRRTWRRFSETPLKLGDLSTLLGLTWGVQHWSDSLGVRTPLTTSPSGGSSEACITTRRTPTASS